MDILKRLVVYAQINNFFEYYKMDRKILILGITLTVVILLLSFRKEGYEEELKDWQTQTKTSQKETIEITTSKIPQSSLKTLIKELLPKIRRTIRLHPIYHYDNTGSNLHGHYNEPMLNHLERSFWNGMV